MGFFEGFAQSYNRARERSEDARQRKEELKLQYALPELMKRKNDWETQKQKDKDLSLQAVTLAEQMGDPSFVPVAQRDLKAGVSYEEIQKRIAEGVYEKSQTPKEVKVPITATNALNSPSQEPLRTIPGIPSKPMAMPEGVKTPLPTQEGLEGPVMPGDDTSGIRRVDMGLRNSVAEVSPELADLYTNSPDTIGEESELRTEDEELGNTGWTIKRNAVGGKLSEGMDKILTDPESAKRFLKAVDDGLVDASEVDVAAANRVAFSLSSTPDDILKNITPAMDASDAAAYKKMYEGGDLNLNSKQVKTLDAVLNVRSEDEAKKAAEKVADRRATSNTTAYMIDGDTVGDTVDVIDGKYYSNGVEVPKEKVKEYTPKQVEAISNWDSSTKKTRDEITNTKNTAKSIVRSGNLVKDLDKNAFTNSALIVLGTANTVEKELSALKAIFSGDDIVGENGQMASDIVQNKAREILSGSNRELYDDATKVAIIKLDLAYKDLANKGQEGNAVSKVDLENALKIVGNDKAKFLNYIKSRVEESKASIKDKYQSLMSLTETKNLKSALGGKLPKSIKDLESEFGDSQETIKTEGLPTVVTAEDYAKIKSGSFYLDENGQQRKKK